MLTAIDQRFDGVDQRFDSIDKRIDGVDKSIEKLEGRINQQDTSFRVILLGLVAGLLSLLAKVVFFPSRPMI
ncbi:MAG: hypothetical protein ACFB4I_19540 [Cyanophyceae cyanobacterium]